ncbi:MAG: AEC family transporter [Thermodesulfobacteriota bacterium]
MADILNSIIPIFAVILLGALLRRIGLLPAIFLGPANQLVYYVAIPVMLFQEIARASFARHFNPVMLLATLLPLTLILPLGVPLARRLKLRSERGTFLQTQFHGNLGYVGLAVAFYALGDEGLTRASLLIGFMLIWQNIQAIIILSLNQISPGSAAKVKTSRAQLLFRMILTHPVIIAVALGLAFSLAGLKLPLVVDRSLKIVSGMSLPLALLLIGASLDIVKFRGRSPLVLVSSFMKLLVSPALGLMLYLALRLPPQEYLPGLILLAAPTASMTYILAKEMHGDQELASNCVSFSTLASVLSYTVWLAILK